MADVIIEVPLSSAEEQRMFGAYVTRFVEGIARLPYAPDADAPSLMLRSDPQRLGELKIVTFQERATAQAFSSGWAATRRRLRQD